MPFAAGSLSWAAKLNRDQIGMQLYTVRDLLKTDFEGTLARVAEIGYREVEFAGYFDHSPKDLRAMLDRHQLTAPSAHIAYGTLGDKWPSVIDAAHTLGHTSLVCPWIDDDVRQQPDGWKRAAEVFNRAAAISQKAGIQFAYHNHHFDFVPIEGGKLAYDFLLEQTDPRLVKMEMDLGWITVARQDPGKYLRSYPGRFPMVHVKDFTKLPPQTGPAPIPFETLFPELTTIGAGVVDWKSVLAECKKAGVEHYFVENDFPHSPMDFLRDSLRYLKNLEV